MMNAAELLDYYAILGLPSGSEGAQLSPDDITQAYFSKCFELQLRRTSGDPNTTEESQEVELSYRILSNDNLRMRYHRHLTRIEMNNLKLKTSEASGSGAKDEEEVDYYHVLGLPSGNIGAKLLPEVIEEAYISKCSQLELAKRLGYPDCTEKLDQVQKSFNFLKDAKRRMMYNSALRAKIEKENMRLETPKARGSSARPKTCQEKMSRAMEKLAIQKRKLDSSPNLRKHWNEERKVVHLLFEFASGYVLLYAHKFDEVDLENFESAEEYITHSDFLMFEEFHEFSCTDEALVEMNAISESIVTELLKSFLLKHLPKPVDGQSNHCIGTCDPTLACNIKSVTGISVRNGIICQNVMRALRMDIGKWIKHLNPRDLKKAQVNLARLYSNQWCPAAYVSSMVVPSSLQIAVVPHNRFEGLFIVKGRDIICSKNLEFGGALQGDDFIFVQVDGTEYRTWNPSKSKLAAAIQCGVTDIWVKPGSRVLYMGDVCANIVSQLSDLVGADGLVYVVGLCNDIVKMAGNRSNVVTIFANPYRCNKYRMVVGMVDVIFADVVAPSEVNCIAKTARFYLKTGGHYMITTEARNINLNGQDLFADYHNAREFNQIELVTLEPIEGAYVMVVGGFRVLEEEEEMFIGGV